MLRDRGRYQGLIGSELCSPHPIGPLIGGFNPATPAGAGSSTSTFLEESALTVILITMPKRRTQTGALHRPARRGILALGTTSLLVRARLGWTRLPMRSAPRARARSPRPWCRPTELFRALQVARLELIIPFHLLANASPPPASPAWRSSAWPCSLRLYAELSRRALSAPRPPPPAWRRHRCRWRRLRHEASSPARSCPCTGRYWPNTLARAAPSSGRESSCSGG